MKNSQTWHRMFAYVCFVFALINAYGVLTLWVLPNWPIKNFINFFYSIVIASPSTLLPLILSYALYEKENFADTVIDMVTGSCFFGPLTAVLLVLVSVFGHDTDGVILYGLVLFIPVLLAVMLLGYGIYKRKCIAYILIATLLSLTAISSIVSVFGINFFTPGKVFASIQTIINTLLVMFLAYSWLFNKAVTVQFKRK